MVVVLACANGQDIRMHRCKKTQEKFDVTDELESDNSLLNSFPFCKILTVVIIFPTFSGLLTKISEN